MTANNIIDLNDYRSSIPKDKKLPDSDTTTVQEFVDNYAVASMAFQVILPYIIDAFERNTIDVSEFNDSDIVLLREAVISMLMRVNNNFHPLQPYAKEFHDYFDKLTVLVNGDDSDNN